MQHLSEAAVAHERYLSDLPTTHLGVKKRTRVSLFRKIFVIASDIALSSCLCPHLKIPINVLVYHLYCAGIVFH